MKASELRAKTMPELKETLHTALRDQFKARMEFGSGQLAQTHKLKQLRREIARIRTVMCEMNKADKSA